MAPFPKMPKTLTGLVLACLLPLAVQAQTSAPAGAATARVIVKFKSDAALLRKQAQSATAAPAERAQTLGARLGLPLRAGMGLAERTQVVVTSGMSSAALAERLGRDPDVEYAVPDGRKFRAAAPNDPKYATAGAPNFITMTGGPASGQWYLRPPQTGIVSAIDAETAWNVSTGSASMVVAVLDTGVRFDHPDLAANLLPGYDLVADADTANDGGRRDGDASDPGDGLTQADIDSGDFSPCTAADIAPSSWHGTKVAGLIGATTDNGVGMASVGRTVRVLPVRVLGKCGGFDSDILAGMRWAAGLSVTGVPANPNPARVVNMSLGGGSGCSAAYRDVVDELVAAGVTIVASAGNGAGHEVSEPAACAGVIGVAGLRHVGTKVGYSDLGPEVSIAAPAGNCVNPNNDPCLYPILTTSNAGEYDPLSNAAGGSTYTDAYDISVGTSFAAPLVAGTAALMLSVHPDLTPAELRSQLRAAARAFPVAAGVPTCAPPSSADQIECNCTTSTCGAGMLDAAAAVSAATGVAARITLETATPRAGIAVELNADASSAAAGRTITSRIWEVTDTGGIVAALAPTEAEGISLTPSAGGRFSVTLTVTDDTGAQSAVSSSIEVAAAADSGGGGGGALGAIWLLLLGAALPGLRRRS